MPEMGELAKKVRDGKLTPTEMSACVSPSPAQRHRRALLHAHHQRPRWRITRCLQSQTETVWDGKVSAAPDAAAELDLGSPSSSVRRRCSRPDRASTLTWARGNGSVQTAQAVFDRLA